MKALVLSGGGSNGAFQVGVLKYLLGTLGRHYDIITGTSVGALNGAILAQGSTLDDMRSLGIQLEYIWKATSNKNVYKNWFLTGIFGGLFKKSLYDSSPLMGMIEKFIDPKKIATSGTKFRAVACSLTTGELEIFTEKSVDILKGVYSSASFPVAFTPMQLGKIKGVANWLTDGGIRDYSPLSHAIRAGASQIDVINCSNSFIDVSRIDKNNSIDILMRTIEIMSNEILMGDLRVLTEVNTQIEAQRNIDPTKRLITCEMFMPHSYLGDSLDFNPAATRDKIEAGFYMAKDVTRRAQTTGLV